MKQYYFILNETYGDRKHIGTVVAGNNEELNEKIRVAIEQHFDGSISGELKISLDSVYLKYGESEEFEVEIEEDEDKFTRSIEISSTWLY